MTRIVCHWTAGGPEPAAEDMEHYHLLVNRQGQLFRGDHPISDNVSTTDDDYAAHTRGLNTGSIGLALCGMANARQSPLKPGPYPLTRKQWNAALLAAADLCRRYQIPARPGRLLMHCEVEAQVGARQLGKWDISALTFDRGKWAAMTPGEELRARVELLLDGA